MSHGRRGGGSPARALRLDHGPLHGPDVDGLYTPQRRTLAGVSLSLHETDRIAVRVIDVEFTRAPGLVRRSLVDRRVRLG